MIQTVIADDHALVRGGIRQMLATTSDIVVVAEAGDGTELFDRLSAHAADVLLLDFTMRGLSGVELIRALRSEYPMLRILVLSVHNDPQTVTHALRAGASGYVTKYSDPHVLIDAIRRLAAGGRFIDPQLVETVVFDASASAPMVDDVLSARERQVLQRFAAGSSINEIAAEFSLSAKTVSTHKVRLMQKLGIHTNAELIRYAIKHNIGTN
ncbi:response regulator [Burkholderia sp. BE17]|uniref:response regulator n=1 Tax=Burkholderia sp. BE17 TaxID=2656644 RepID=UPI00128BA077|nr:response regulator transcription factor [Burkholderia sp. BE17]MPV71569.1 response regulator [Burkholderia sp. BE17]